jgi:DNA-binding MarR family transcriptional regulator
METPPLDAVNIANELRPLLLRLARELRREGHPLGVTGGQVALLAVIQQNAGIGVHELASKEGVSAPNISIHVRRLERLGLVERTPGTDRRRIGLTTTSEAARIIRLVKSRRTAWLTRRLARLEPVELHLIAAAVEPLQKLLDEPD